MQRRSIAVLTPVIVAALAACAAAPTPPPTATTPGATPGPSTPSATPTPTTGPPGPLAIGPEGAIVFYRTDDAREVNTQFIVNPDGTGERQLTPELANAVWSPDGSWLAFAWGDWDSGKIRPAVMHPDGSGFRVLDAQPDRLIRLAPRAWSADGKRLILWTGGKDNAKLEDVGLWSIRVADAGHLRQLIGATDPADVGEMFVPSPDGTKVLHNRIWGDRPNEPDLNVLSVEFMDGRHETRISPPNPNLTVVDLQFYDETSEAWSPESTEIVFCVVDARNGESAMYVTSRDGREFRPGPAATELVEFGFGAVSAQFSPDGKHIAFTAERGPDDQVWVMDRDGSNRRQLTSGDDGSLSVLPLWSPDGKHLVFQRRMHPDDPITLWRIDVDGSHLLQLSSTPLAQEWVGGYAWWPAPQDPR